MGAGEWIGGGEVNSEEFQKMRSEINKAEMAALTRNRCILFDALSVDGAPVSADAANACGRVR